MSRAGSGEPGDHDEAVAEAIRSIAGLVRAGVAPQLVWSALDGPAAPAPVRAAAAARPGSVPRALAAAGGGEPWALAASVWRLSERTGAPLHPILLHLAAAMEDRAATARAAAEAAAGPRSSARLIAWLPVASLGVGSVLGADVVGVLAGSVPGAVGGGAGLLLNAAGLVWIRRLVAAATAPPAVAGLFSAVVGALVSAGIAPGLALVDARPLAPPPQPAPRALLRRTFAGSARGRGGDGTSSEPSEPAEAAALVDRSSATGLPLAPLLAAASERCRHRSRSRATRRAARLATDLLLPVGVCALPAFLLLGVFPVVVSLVPSTLSP